MNVVLAASLANSKLVIYLPFMATTYNRYCGLLHTVCITFARRCSIFDFRDLFSHECYFATVLQYPSLAVLQYSSVLPEHSHQTMRCLLPLSCALVSRALYSGCVRVKRLLLH